MLDQHLAVFLERLDLEGGCDGGLAHLCLFTLTLSWEGEIPRYAEIFA